MTGGMGWPKLLGRLRGLWLPIAPASPVEGRNIRHLFLEVAWWGLANGICMNYVSVYAVRLGASSFWVGVLLSGPALLSILWLVPAGRLVEAQRRQMPLLNGALLASRVFLLLMAVSPWLWPANPGVALVLLVVLQAIPFGLGTVAFTTAIAEAVSRENLGQVVSQRNAIIGAATTLGTLLSVPLLAAFPMPLNYQVVFAFGFASAMFSTYFVSRLQVPDRPAPLPQASAPTSRRPALSWGALREAWREQPAYAWFVVASIVFHWGWYTGIPLFPLYWVRVLGLTDTEIGLMKVVVGVSMVVGALAASRFLTRWDNRQLLLLSTLGMAGYPVGTALTRSFGPLLFVSFWGGFISTLLAVALFNRLIEVTPASRRASYVGFYNAVINVSIFAAPLVSTTLSDRWGVTTMMFLSGGLRIVGGLLYSASRGGAPEGELAASPCSPAVAAAQPPGGQAP